MSTSASRIRQWRRPRTTQPRAPRESYTVEISVTAALIVLGAFITTTDFGESTKLALVVLLGTFEMMFLFFRTVIRRLQALTTSALTVIPRSGLGHVLYEHLNAQRDQLVRRITLLTDRLSCELEKHEMYAELIGLTEIVTQHRAEHPDGFVSAVSSVNIEDFDGEPLAEAYLASNRKAVSRGVVIQRVFLLDPAQRLDPQVIAILQKHHEALSQENAAEGSGVKWLLKSHLTSATNNQDFALFAHDVLVAQGQGGQHFELTQDGDKLTRALRAFRLLWQHQQAKPVSSLTQSRRR